MLGPSDSLRDGEALRGRKRRSSVPCKGGDHGDGTGSCMGRGNWAAKIERGQISMTSILRTVRGEGGGKEGREEKADRRGLLGAVACSRMLNQQSCIPWAGVGTTRRKSLC